MSDEKLNSNVETEKLLDQKGIDVLPNTQSFIISETELSELKTLLDKRYTEIVKLLRYNKTKDESIQRLSGEIQKYREGFAFSALKPFINALISMREDCKKSIRDANKFSLDDEKVNKFIEYLISDFEEMFSNIGLERTDETIKLNGKSLSNFVEIKKQSIDISISEQENNEPSGILINSTQIKNISELIEYLNKMEFSIRQTIQDKSIIDKTIQEYVTLTARTDAEHYFALVAPVSRQVFKLYDNISVKSKTIQSYSGDELIKFYHAILDDIVNGIEVVLTNTGLKIETSNDIFDTQKHKLLKTIPTSDETLDRKIADTYTDCYIYDDKVVYQSKVDVYKFQQINKGDENHG